jgi:hypothetical protein
MLKYDELWPRHPFRFRIAFQELAGVNRGGVEFVRTDPGIRDTVLQLIADLPEDEWVYWCVDDKYPIELRLEKIEPLVEETLRSQNMDALLFCRWRALLSGAEEALLPSETRTAAGEVLLERRSWHQFWIHQLMRVKVLRYMYSSLPDLPGAKAMNPFENNVIKPDEFHLFVTKENHAVFGESTSRGAITPNCYESMMSKGLTLPETFREPSGKPKILGKLSRVWW